MTLDHKKWSRMTFSRDGLIFASLFFFLERKERQRGKMPSYIQVFDAINKAKLLN